MGQELGGKQNISLKCPSHRASHAAKGKAKVGCEDSEIQRRDPTGDAWFKEAVDVLLPSSSRYSFSGRSRRSGISFVSRGSEEGTTPTEEIEEQRNTPRVPFMSKEKEKMRNNAIGEDGEGVKGFVSAHHTSQPSLPLRYPFSGVAPPYQSPFDPDLSISAFHSQFPMRNRVLTENCLKKKSDVGDHRLGYVGNPNHVEVESQMAGMNLMSESFKYDKTNPSSPHGVPILGAVSKGDSDFSQMSGFQIEESGCSDVSGNKKRGVRQKVCSSVWSVRNKEWAILPACGASGGILIIWDSKKMRGEEVVIGSFSVSVRFLLDGSGPLWLSAVYGPNNPSIRKEFWVEMLDLFGLTYPSWCVGGDFNVIRRRSEKLGGSGVTSSMRDF
ncbi:hypothetical protein CK203_062462 [Vitis vinifera]|uniref:Uncharacterized protein n=1 Tax=Vitis vinifera TaxID=29760 RepID=A0A438FUD3_VITVI|nr:hypothetical protein CK203_062462 [Vitis vinifera]